MAGFDVDVAGIARDVEIGPPAGGEFGGALDGAIGVVGGGDQHGREFERIARKAAERRGLGRHVGVLVDIGRRDEEGSLDLGIGKRLTGRDDGVDAERMADENHRAGGHHDFALEGFEPARKGRRVPFVLLDETGVADLFDPAVLPVAGAGMAQAGNDEDVGVGGFHSSFTWGISRERARADHC